MNAEHQFAVGQDVIIIGGVSRIGRPDKIVRETPTRWVCASGKWFDKQTNRGPRPKSDYTTPEKLNPGNDRALQREMNRDRFVSLLLMLDRQVRNQRVIDTVAARAALDNLTRLLDSLDGENPNA